MNKILALIYCLALSNVVLAQKDSLAVDDRGKHIYYKVVNMDKHTADELYKKSLHFFNSNTQKDFKIIAQDKSNYTISGAGFFIVYKPSLAKHADGQISYNLKLEIKGSKYRYWLTDFTYTPYFRDRYNNYVPDNGIQVPLEKSSKSITEKELGLYLDQAALFSRQLGERLKTSLVTANVPVAKKDTTKKVIHINKDF